MMYPILDPIFIITATSLLLLSIIFHEFGHWIYIKRRKKKNLKLEVFRKGWFNFGLQMRYKGKLTNAEQKNFILFGVAMGFIPLFIGIGFNHLGYMLLFPMYVVGCRHDYTMLLKLVEEELKEKEMVEKNV